ncbi:MAG: hypothetical protein U0744_17315 [Gemmataceae bacterium]
MAEEAAAVEPSGLCQGKSKTPALDSQRAEISPNLPRQSKLDPVIGRSNEIERVVQISSSTHQE